jgi:hypothetical protein
MNTEIDFVPDFHGKGYTPEELRAELRRYALEFTSDISGRWYVIGSQRNIDTWIRNSALLKGELG